MSRLVVKNLPGETTEGDLYRMFSQKGALTDVDVKRNSKGKSRKFAFVGFHNERDADEAIKTFNHSFIKTNKIQVTRCIPLSAAEFVGKKLPSGRIVSKTQAKRAEKKSRKRLGIVPVKKYPKKESLGIPVVQEILLEKYQTDPDFAAFLDLRSPGQAARCREMLNLPKRDNLDIDPDVNIDFPEKEQRLKRREVINLLFHVKLKSLPKKTNKTQIKEFFNPLKCVSIRQPRHAFSVAFVGFMHEHERRRALEKDKSYLNGQAIRVIEYNDDYKRKKIIDVGPPSFRIYFYDLPPSYTPEEIERLFSAHGKLKSIVMPRYASSNKLKGYGLVTYEDKEDAKRAFEKLSNSPLRDIIVLSPEQNSRVTTGKLEECGFFLEGTFKRSSESEEDGDEDEDEPKKKRWKNQEDSLKNEESVAESGRIFMRNLSYTTQEADIEKLFATYGPITEINLPIDSETKQLKGFGIVTFLMPEHAVKAFTELDGTILHGRMLHLIPGKSKDTPDVEESSNFKEKKLNKQKAEAGKAHNWNALFVDHNAVAEVVADKFGTSKEAILGPEIKGSAAVRLALAETQIVNETKKYLEEMGVRLDAFNESKSQKRSKTTILVKNLPSKTEPKELRQIFQKHGQIARLILPPNGLTAIIEYLDPSEARKAFVSLAYSKFKHSPLYLEWAPEGSLDNVAPKSESVKAVETTEGDSNVKQGENHNDKVDGVNKVVANEVTGAKSTHKLPEGNPELGTTLFVKNINFQTRNEALRKHFEQIGPLYYAYVVTKKGGSSDAPELSRGYGFVRYMLKSDADRALEQLQQSVLDEKSLELARSDRSERDDVEEKQNKDKKSKVKLIVKNIPFAAKNKEVGEIFSTFGGLKRLKLPKKLGAEANRHRGYAFVEFTNESDAKGAYEALHLSTHLLGRRLVLEWAKDDEDIDEIRKKTEEHYAPQKKAESKKSVFKIE